MKKQMLKSVLMICVTTLLLSFPNELFSQAPMIFDYGVKNLLEVSFDVTITFNDNTTETKTLNPNDETVFAAPLGKHIVKLTAGTKTVNLPMTPSPQTGWNIAGIPPSVPVYANHIITGPGGIWQVSYGVTMGMLFSY